MKKQTLFILALVMAFGLAGVVPAQAQAKNNTQQKSESSAKAANCRFHMLGFGWGDGTCEMPVSTATVTTTQVTTTAETDKGKHATHERRRAYAAQPQNVKLDVKTDVGGTIKVDVGGTIKVEGVAPATTEAAPGEARYSVDDLRKLKDIFVTPLSASMVPPVTVTTTAPAAKRGTGIKQWERDFPAPTSFADLQLYRQANSLHHLVQVGMVGDAFLGVIAGATMKTAYDGPGNVNVAFSCSFIGTGQCAGNAAQAALKTGFGVIQ